MRRPYRPNLNIKLPAEEFREEKYPLELNQAPPASPEDLARTAELKRYKLSADPVERFIGRVLAAFSEDGALLYCPGAAPILGGKSLSRQTRLQTGAFTAKALWLPVIRAIRAAPDKAARRAAVPTSFAEAVKKADISYQTVLMEERRRQEAEERKAAGIEDPFPIDLSEMDRG